MGLILADIPYCGPAPTPVSLSDTWNVDPIAIGLGCVLIAVHWRMRGREGRWPLGLGVALLAAIFLSPLCALASALFSARAVHHVLLIAVAAPLLALAFPRAAGRVERLPLGALVGLHAAVLWFWHLPQAYALGIGGAVPFWTMQVTLLVSAFALWRRILGPQTAIGPVQLALLATVVQMGLLGALLTFAPAALYGPHLSTTAAFGMTPLQDQQLAGLIMWVPAALPYLAVALLRLGSLLDPDSRGRNPVAGA